MVTRRTTKSLEYAKHEKGGMGTWDVRAVAARAAKRVGRVPQSVWVTSYYSHIKNCHHLPCTLLHWLSHPMCPACRIPCALLVISHVPCLSHPMFPCLLHPMCPTCRIPHVLPSHLTRPAHHILHTSPVMSHTPHPSCRMCPPVMSHTLCHSSSPDSPCPSEASPLPPA